jgi:uncharacterized protein
MIVEDQSDVLAYLRDPASHGGEAVEEIETHAAHVFLVGERAYKLKRSVRFAFLDFSTIALRQAACESELAFNRRTAPELYLAVAAVTRDADGRLALDGAGEAVDWLVVMQRFDQETLFDRLASRGALDDGQLRDLADAIAAFHDIAEPRPDMGGREGLAHVIAGNMATLREGEGTFAPSAIDTIERLWRRGLDRHGALLDARRGAGQVRWCHGDLHLRNICLIDGRPTLFDGIEFNPDIACIDVLYDLAFLLMDLQHRGMARAANLVLNRYLGRTEDVAGLALLPFFQSLRAGVRAMVSAIEAGEGHEEQGPEARDYLDLATTLLERPPPGLIAVGGYSGSGKSSLAADVAAVVGAAPGAVVLRSDVVRKRLMGVAPEAALAKDAYRGEVTQRVYGHLHALARRALAAGATVILDAVHGDAAERDAAAALAAKAGVPFCGLWLEASPTVLRSRVAARRGDASDATLSVLESQLDRGAGDIAWTRLDAAGAPGDVSTAALSVLARAGIEAR